LPDHGHEAGHDGEQTDAAAKGSDSSSKTPE